MNTSKTWMTVVALTCVSAGCVTASPPADLLAARTAYQRAREGTAKQLDPADLHTAEEALSAAERSFTEAGDTTATRDLAYVARRRAQIADARADALKSQQEQQKTIGAMHAEQADQIKTTSAQLGLANEKLTLQGQALATEHDGRIAADKRAAQATADLEKFASVKQESRGLVITLSGSVLFASSKADLLQEAELRLNSVAQTLTQQDPDSRMVVEGYTDSQGAMAYNQDLSLRRAQTVRNYLVSRGIAADRVTSKGFGSTRAIADNGSPEGRANNRRVEIVVEPAASAAM